MVVQLSLETDDIVPTEDSASGARVFAPDLAYRLMSIVSKRIYIAGVLENRSDNLVAWIVSPQSFSPQTAMPNTGISEQEAKNLAAYLYAH